MSLFVDERFVNNIGHLLRNFRKKQDYLWNFSCPLCGDSRKKKVKARGYIFRYRDVLKFKCHNCGETLHLSELIRHLDLTLYKEYIYETFLEKGQSPPKEDDTLERPVKFKKKKDYRPAKPSALVGCPSISSLGPDHPARAYLESRKLPSKFLEEIYWTDDFPSVVDKFCPGHQYALMPEGRIIIPFLDSKKQLIAMQGRSMPKYVLALDRWIDAPGTVRYITIKSDKEAPRIFGMDRLSKFTKRIYGVEGPIDSMFLPNAIAMAGSDIPEGLPRDRTVIVYDNERHSEQTVNKIRKAIDRGYTVCIWPDNVKEKDINLMVINGNKPERVRECIDMNLFSGLEAKLKLQHWANPKGFAGKGNVSNTSFTYKGYNH